MNANFISNLKASSQNIHCTTQELSNAPMWTCMITWDRISRQSVKISTVLCRSRASLAMYVVHTSSNVMASSHDPISNPQLPFVAWPRRPPWNAHYAPLFGLMTWEHLITFHENYQCWMMRFNIVIYQIFSTGHKKKSFLVFHEKYFGK